MRAGEHPMTRFGMAAVLLVGGLAAVQAQSSATDVQKRLVGNWRLVSFVSFDEKGVSRPGPVRRRADCCHGRRQHGSAVDAFGPAALEFALDRI